MHSRWTLALACCAAAIAQTSAPPATESTVKDETVTFKARVNLVMVPVVVRDKQGRAIGTLKQEDFQLLDRGKPQLISRFSIEHAGRGAGTAGSKGAKAADTAMPGGVVMPDRYVAYLFDDIHISFGDLARARDAAWEHMRDGLRATDRAAIYTTSGQTVLDFTDDKDALHETLLKIRLRPISGMTVNDCPEVGYYLGDLIQNHNDTMALAEVTAVAMVCMHMDASMRTAAESMARAAASRAVAVGGQETRVALGVLRDVVRRMAATPGQRSIILAGPGFLAPEFQQEKNELIDRAIRANVTINSLDARGVWVDPSFDAARPREALRYVRDEAMANGDVLAEFAYGTGGKYFHDNNDLREGFRSLAEVPEYLYVLGFSPQNLKLDGTYHSLKVTLRTPPALVASARRGYYAPRHLTDPVETAKEEIREALFSREEMREIPVELQSQFFKPGENAARVTLLARIDLRNLKFRKDEDRNKNNLTVTFGLFDRNGNYVAGTQKLVDMRLRDETLARPNLGIVVRGTVDVKPGAYLIRVVVRDAEGSTMTALNGAADIP
jgi:VWFA-related protein